MNIIPWQTGMKIYEPGIYSGVPMEVYHGTDLCDGISISSSGLRSAFWGPKYFWSKSAYNPDREPEKKNHAFTLGRAAHHLLLGEAEFEKHFCVRPDTYPDSKTGEPKAWTGNANWCKAWIAEHELKGLEILSSEDMKDISGMRDSLAADPLIQAGLLNGLIEHTMVWKDEKTGLWLKIRPDAIPQQSDDAADLKTTTEASVDAIEAVIGDNGYHQQGALIREGFQKVLGRSLTSFNLAFVEKKPPYCAAVVAVSDFDLDTGHEQNHLALEYIAQCFKAKNWPGPLGTVSDARPVMIKPWMQTKIEIRRGEIREELERFKQEEGMVQ